MGNLVGGKWRMHLIPLLKQHAFRISVHILPQEMIKKRIEHLMIGWPMNQQQILVNIEVETAEKLKSMVYALSK